MNRLTRGEKVFIVMIYVVFAVVALLMLVPVLYVLKRSFDVGAGDITLSLIPKEFSAFYYRIVLRDKGIYRTFVNSAYITIVGTVLAVALQSMGAYTLHRKELPGHSFFTYMLIIPMMFGGGLVPFYLLMKTLRMIDTFAVLIIPACMSGWNMFLIRNYYNSIPASLEESARIDGANEFVILWRIVFPVSTPVIAAIALFTAVGYWNTFFSALIFINTPTKFTFPVKLREMLLVQQQATQRFEEMLAQGGEGILRQNLTNEGLSAAMIILSMLPIIIIYPYLQKYFVKGIMVGSLKG